MAEIQFPEENELVLATIKKVMPYGAFCTLTEYNNLESFLHVSEVAPRWIKNIREFISENQRIVVKILRVDIEKGQVDVSLRRVSEEEKRNKLESVKRGARVDKLLQIAITKSKSQIKVADLVDRLAAKYPDAYSAIEASLESDDALKEVDIPDALKKEITDIVRKSIKKARVSARADITLKCFSAEGIETIRKILSVKDADAAVHYVGAPHYYMEVFSSDYKLAGKKLEKLLKEMASGIPRDCSFEYKVQE